MFFHNLLTLFYILAVTGTLSHGGHKTKARWLPHLLHTETGIIDIPPEQSPEEFQSQLQRRLSNSNNNNNNNNDNNEELFRRQMIGSNSLTDEEKQAILDAHNKYRILTARGDTSGQPTATNMQELFWDPALAKVAENYSRSCLFEHNSARLIQFKAYSSISSFTHSSSMSVGENLYLTTRTVSLDSLLKGLEAFYAEYQYFDFDTIGCVSGQQCGHYRQMVQATTRYVGCGYTYCPSAYYSGGNRYYTNAILMTCNYSPAVNAQPYVQGAPCSGCLQDRVCVNKSICGGCPNPNYWYCLDSSTSCSGVASYCPTLPKCDFDSTNTMCSLCRTTCKTCDNERVNGSQQSLSCNNGISWYTTSTGQTPSPTPKPIQTKPPTLSPASGINQKYCCHAYSPERYEERCNLLTSEDTCNDDSYSRRCYWQSSSQCPTPSPTSTLNSASIQYHCTSEGTRKKASCELITKQPECEFSSCTWSIKTIA